MFLFDDPRKTVKEDMEDLLRLSWGEWMMVWVVGVKRKGCWGAVGEGWRERGGEERDEVCC